MKSIEEMITVFQEETDTILQIERSQFKTIDEIACGVLKTDCPEYMVPIDCHSNQAAIKYRLTCEWENLRDYQGGLKINQVLRLYDQILYMIEDCEDYFLCPEGFCLDLAYVYIHKKQAIIQFIYVPELHQEINWQKAKDLLLSILDKCEETSGERYQVQFYKALYKKDFNFEVFKKVMFQIKREMASEAWHDNSVNGERQDDSFKEHEEDTNRPLDEEKKRCIESEKKEADYDIITSAQRMQKQIEELVHTVYQEETMDEKLMPERTFMLRCVSTETRYNLPQQIEIPIENTSFIIGRAAQNVEGEKADFEFGAAITPISRLHAQITKKEGEYYIQDLGSSNGTYLNGMRLEAKTDYLLSDGDRIAFAIAYSKNSIEYSVDSV